MIILMVIICVAVEYHIYGSNIY